MATEVFMPKAGMDMREGYINRWLVEVGEAVREGDALLEIETDKVTMEVEAPCDGTLLRKYFDAGDTVPVVTVIGYIGEAGETVPDAPAQAGAARQPADGAMLQGMDYDVAVIGGGPAGYTAALRAAQLGGRVVLFERDALGGTCLHRGCIPTKTYLSTAAYLRHIRAAHTRGILLDTESLSIDMEKVVSGKTHVVQRLEKGITALLRNANVQVVRGVATLTGAHTVTCGDKAYTARSILLCGGSKPGTLPIPGAAGSRVVTADILLEQREVPARLAVIGGGVAGCELATVYAAFGARVTILEAMDRPVPGMDADVSAAIAKALRKAGIDLRLGARVERIEADATAARIHMQGQPPVEAELVLLAVGREAALDCLGSMAGDIRLERGRIAVDAACRTSVPHIYACGDCTAASTLAHAAFAMGEAAAANAMGGQAEAALEHVPNCLYTLPEAAGVGRTEIEARAQYGRVLVGKAYFAANGRAVAAGEPEGFVKVIAEAQYGELLGVHIVGGNATELIAQAKALMEYEITVHEAAQTIHAHPTYAEALGEACRLAIGEGQK